MSTLDELYELTKEFRGAENAYKHIIDRDEEPDAQALTSLKVQLETLNIPINEKIEELYKWRRKELAKLDATKAEIDRLKSRLESAKRRHEGTVEFLDGVVKAVLGVTGQKKVKLPIGTVYLQKNPGEVNVDVDKAADWPEEFKARVYSEEVVKKVDKSKLKKLPGFATLEGVEIIAGTEGVRYR